MLVICDAFGNWNTGTAVNAPDGKFIRMELEYVPAPPLNPDTPEVPEYPLVPFVPVPPLYPDEPDLPEYPL
jgi:hypothetical protein